jgi:hypothetical protein
MDYFDGCYFDGAYFDAAPCVTPSTSGGRSGRIARRVPSFPEPEEFRNDDEEALLVLEGFDG